MTNRERDRLGAAWLQMALGEHASVAAFAKLVLHLMALGSPAELLRAAIGAMKDEVEHAVTCFRIAKRFNGAAAGPSPINMSGLSNDDFAPETILRAAIVEGCYEETVASGCVRRARDRAIDAEIREALAVIAEDESRHADLSWNLVEWMLHSRPEMRGFAERCFTAVLERNSEFLPPPIDQDLVEGYGVLQAKEEQEIRHEITRSVVVPRIEALFGLPTGSTILRIPVVEIS